MKTSLRLHLGALLHDWPRFEAAIRGLGMPHTLPFPWVAVCNRNEKLSFDGRGARCEWEFTSDLHLTRVFPSAGRRLMERAFSDHPIELREYREAAESPEISFVVGHRGRDRLPHLLATLRSIAGQRGPSIECIVVEQSVESEIRDAIPSWVRYLHTPIPGTAFEYSRARAFNAGAQQARGRLLVLHDNDMLCPTDYAAEILAQAGKGAEFIDLKRFIFYLDESASNEVFSSQTIPPGPPQTVVQNAQGGSLAATRSAFFDIGGFDESFVGWGGEDNEFRERAETTGRVNAFGYLPFLHLWHPPQAGKLAGRDAPAVKRYHELSTISADERIRRLRAKRARRDR